MTTAFSFYLVGATTPTLLGTIQPDAIDGYSASRDAQHVVTPLPVSSGIPQDDVNMRPMTQRTGQITLAFASQANAFVVESWLASYNAVVYMADSDVPKVNMWFIVHGGQLTVELDQTTGTVWLVRIPFRQVYAPAGAA